MAVGRSSSGTCFGVRTHGKQKCRQMRAIPGAGKVHPSSAGAKGLGSRPWGKIKSNPETRATASVGFIGERARFGLRRRSLGERRAEDSKGCSQNRHPRSRTQAGGGARADALRRKVPADCC